MFEFQEYQSILIVVFVERITQILKESQPGHCLRLEGVHEEVLHHVCAHFHSNSPNHKVVLLSNKPQKTYEITATKLVELRNTAENNHVLLVFIPSTLRTAAEDSFDRATFKQIEIEDFQNQIVSKLSAKMPDSFGRIFQRIIDFFKMVGRPLPITSVIRFQLACQHSNYHEDRLGKNLHQLGLIPDSDLTSDQLRLEQRMHQNLSSVALLKDSAQPLITRIMKLDIKPNTIQKELYNYFTTVSDINDVQKWAAEISENPDLKSLDLANWPFFHQISPEEFKLYMHPLKGKSVVVREGEKYIETLDNKDVNVSIKLETVPSPAQLNQITHFRIDLMRTNNEGKIEHVMQLQKFAKTGGQKTTRTKQITLSPDEIEQGTYFFRALALDENGIILNTNDDFVDSHYQEQWENLKSRYENASRDEIHGKMTSDSEDFSLW